MLSKETQSECLTVCCPKHFANDMPNWDSLATELLKMFGQMSKGTFFKLWMAELLLSGSHLLFDPD